MKAKKSSMIHKIAASENESQEDYNNLNESGSDDPDVSFNPKPSSSKKVHHSRSRSVHIPTQQTSIYAIHRRTSHGLDCKLMVYITDF